MNGEIFLFSVAHPSRAHWADSVSQTETLTN